MTQETTQIPSKRIFLLLFQKKRIIRSPFPVYYHTLYTHYGGGGGGGGGFVVDDYEIEFYEWPSMSLRCSRWLS